MSPSTPILAGTGAPNPGLVHGASLHRELQHLVGVGLNPVDALASLQATNDKIMAAVQQMWPGASS